MKPIEASGEIRAVMDSLLEQVTDFGTHRGPEAYLEADALAGELIQLVNGIARELPNWYYLATLDRVASIAAHKADQKIARMKV